MTITTSRPTRMLTPPTCGSSGGTKNTQWTKSLATSIVMSSTGASLRPAIETSIPEPKSPGGTKLAGRRSPLDTHIPCATSNQPEWGQVARTAAEPSERPLLDPTLSLAAEILDGIEKVRIANGNRLGQLTRSEEDSDGELRGFGLDESHPDVATLAAMVDTLKKLEHEATLQLQRRFRDNPLCGWQKQHRGVGEKQAARLLAAIGDPYIRHELTYKDGTSLPAGPRTVSALWAYCGLHVVDGAAPRLRRGQQANWSLTAKTRAYLVSASCFKQLVKPCVAGDHVAECVCSPYRLIYDARRARTDISHPEWTYPRRHDDALRITSKAILRDMWRAARDVHVAASQ